MAHGDTSIYEGLLRQAPHEGPLDMATKAIALKTAMGRAQMQPLEMEQTRLENERLRTQAANLEEDRADAKVLQDLYGQVQNDKSIAPEKKLEALRERAAGKVKPRTLEALSKQIEEHANALTKMQDEHLKTVESTMKEVGNTAAGILSAPPESQNGLYQQERARMIQQGIAKPEDIPETFDANWLQMAATHAMGAQNAATAELNRREDKRKQDEAERKAHSEELATAGQTINSVTNQDEYTAWRDKLRPSVKALTAATFTPANVATIKRMALTAAQGQQADEAAARLTEERRHNEAMEKKKPEAASYTGQLRAALVAIGAKDPDNPTAAEASKALDRVKPEAGEKPVPKSTLVGIESRKTAAIKASKTTLDKEIAAATVGGKVLDQAAIDQAWEDHIGRLQDAQRGYESELTTATGNDVGHNDWADRLKAPGKGGAAPAAGAPPAGAAPAQPAGGAPAAAAPNPKAKALVSKYKKGDVVKLRGKDVRITSIDPETGNFEYEPAPAPTK